ncbi:MAG: hypothetical protein ACE5LB_16425, partial [Acidiferrobacterales bacterium]
MSDAMGTDLSIKGFGRCETLETCTTTTAAAHATTTNGLKDIVKQEAILGEIDLAAAQEIQRNRINNNLIAIPFEGT